MAKLSRKEVREKAQQFADLQAAIARANAAREKDLAPIVERHNEELKPLLAKHDKKLQPLLKQAGEIEAEVTAWLNQQPGEVRIEADGAVAERKIESKTGSRIANVEKFLAYAATKGKAIYACVKVVLKDAEKLIGKDELDKICDKETTTETVCTLRLK